MFDLAILTKSLRLLCERHLTTTRDLDFEQCLLHGWLGDCIPMPFCISPKPKHSSVVCFECLLAKMVEHITANQ